MRAFAFVSALSLALPGMAEAQPPPRRVASLNLCTDELLLMLAAPAQIASVTHLSQQPAESPLWRRARRHRANDGSLLTVSRFQPDLVLTMGGSAPDRAGIARRLGIRTLALPFPQTIADVEKSIARVGAALGRPIPARALLARFAGARRTAPPTAIDAAWLGGGGRSVAPTSLAAAWMRLAGLRQRSLPGDRLTLEQLLVRPPSILLRSDYRSGQYSREQSWLAHPLARQAKGSTTIATDGRRWTCMGPLMVTEIVRLQGLAR